MTDAVLKATIKAYDEFTQLFQRFQSELKKTDQTQKQTAQGTEQLNRSTANFFQTIGNLGALYAFQRGLREVMATGREFQLTIKQAQAVTGDFSSTLRDLSMVSSGSKLDVFTPSQLAQAYRELGAAGATTNEIIDATPDILEFGTAALIDMNASAEAVLATAKSFNIALTDSGSIVDAYTESMNRGALSGEDFKWIMGSVGAVAKMAGQDFREILSVGSAMRDSGIQAQDAGTSIKGALLQLINPTKEAQGVMKDLGINVYDASGKMKQWSEITAEFEKALAPLNEQSRNLVLTTILGSDGIRAMATSINKGSGYLVEFTDGLKNSEGATNKMASAMADTFDGAIRRTNASLERAKVLLFEDFAEGSVGFLESINTLVVGFNNVDEGTRKTIELLVGSMGLVAALGLIASTIRIVAIPALQSLGITASVALGPWGLLIAGVTVLTGLFLGSRVAEAGARAEMESHNKTIVATGESYLRLNEKLVNIKKDTEEYKSLQGQTNSALQELARQMPEVVAAWNAEGEAIAIDNDLLREKIRLTKEAKVESAKEDVTGAQQDYDAKKRVFENLQKQRDDLLQKRAQGDVYADSLGSEVAAEGSNALISIPIDDAIRDVSLQVQDAKEKMEIARSESSRLYAIIQGDQSSGDVGIGRPKTSSRSIGSTTVGGTPYSTSSGSTKKAKTIEDLAREEFEASRKWIEHKKALSQLTAEEEIAAWERVSVRYQDGTELRMQADEGLYQAKQRLALEEQQLYDDAYQQAMDLMRHQVNMSRMSTDQQIKYLEKLREAHAWSTQQMMSIEEDLYRLRKQQLSGYLSELEDEYREKLDAIDARVDKTTKAIQDQIDALEGQGTASTREEATRKHNEKLKQLQEDRLYHELRTGVEHQKSIKDIDEQIAEEKIEFQLQQDEWAREDKRDALQEQLDDAKDAGEEERDELEEHYQRARQIAESGIMDIIASLAATKPEWMETGKELIDALIDGLESGDFSSVERKIDRIRDSESSTLEPNIPRPSDDDEEDPASMTWQQKLVYFKTHVSEAMAEIARAGQVYSQKLAAGDIDGARSAHRWADQIRKALGQSMVFDSNTESSPSVHNSYAKGGAILYDQIAQLHAGEYVLPANLVDAIRRGTVPPAQASGGGGTIIYINAPLLAPEALYLSDEMDIKQVGIGLRKEIMALATAKG
jgi:TP901 family phage tail tape measure protein